jgi:hypothetical protein
LCISFHELITVIVAVLIMLILGWLGLKTVWLGTTAWACNLLTWFINFVTLRYR